MGQGFRGDGAVKYFDAVATALAQAKTITGLSYIEIADGNSGGHKLDVGSSLNIVIVDSSYKTGASKMLRTDAQILGSIRDVITQLEDACRTIFRMPATTAKVNDIIVEIRAVINEYLSFTADINSNTISFLSEMSAHDSGAFRVYNNCDINTHITESEDNYTKQINELNNIRLTLTSTLQTLENSLSVNRTRLTAHQNGWIPASSSATQSDIVNLQNTINGLNLQIQNTNAEIKKIDDCIDFLNTSKAETTSMADDLVANVRSVDDRYATSVRDINVEAIHYSERLRQLVTQVDTGFNAAVVKERIGMVSCSDTLDILLAALAILEDGDRIAIFEIVLSAPKPYRCLFFHFADKINITDITASGIFYLPGSKLPCGAIATTSEIHFNVINDRTDPRGSYWVFFHEIGHMIDWYIGQGDGFFSSKTSTDSQRFFDAMTTDVSRRLNSVAGSIVSQPPYSIDASISPAMTIYINSLREQAIANIMAGKKVERNNAVTELDFLQLSIQDSMNDILQGADNSKRTPNNMITPSNIYGGVTNNAVRGNYSHTIDNYWYDSKGSATGSHQVEYFGNHFANSMVNDTEALQNERDFFPTASDVLDDMINDITSRI